MQCKRRFRLASGPKYHAEQSERKIELYNTKYEKYPYFAIQCALRTWAYLPLTRDRFSWNHHVPVLTNEKLARHCASCQTKRRGGYKLWWQRKQHGEEGHVL
jgi:hypothetical protein